RWRMPAFSSLHPAATCRGARWRDSMPTSHGSPDAGDAIAPGAQPSPSLSREGSADLDACFTGADLADDGRVAEAFAHEDLEYITHRLRCAGHQQAARGLRIGEQVAGDGVDVAAQAHPVAVG